MLLDIIYNQQRNSVTKGMNMEIIKPLRKIQNHDYIFKLDLIIFLVIEFHYRSVW